MEKRGLIKHILTKENVLFAAIGIMAICLFLLRLMLACSYLPETGGVSINVLYGIARILNGPYLYTSPEAPPFPIIQYMPLHFYIIKGIAYLAGIEKNLHGIMVLNRTFCLFIDCLCVLLIARSLKRHFSLSPVFSWTLALLYFICIPGIIYGRGDNLYLLFFILTVIPLLQSFSPEKITGVYNKYLPFMAGFTSALAICTKQTGLFLGVYCLIFILMRKQVLKDALSYATAFLICCLLVLLVTHPADSLLSLKLNVVDGVKNGVNVNWFMEVFLKNYFLKFSYLLAGGLVIGLLLLKSGRQEAGFFTGIGILWYFTAAVISSFKAGSGPNYYLEFIILSIFGLALLISGNKINYQKNLLYVLVLAPFFLIASANDKGWGDTRLMKRAQKDYENSRQIADYILPRLQKEQWVLTDFHKESTINLQMMDKALFPCREVALYFTKPIGVFHFRTFGKMINTPSIPYIVGHKDQFPGVFLDDSLYNYQKDTTIGNYTIYRLKQ